MIFQRIKLFLLVIACAVSGVVCVEASCDPIYHPNGVLAWSGVKQKDLSWISEQGKFFHSNQKLAWGGLNNMGISWISDNGKFYHPNGNLAWGGLNQNKISWISDNGKFYHANGKLAWGGLDQEKISWISDNGKFYHYNGELACRGLHEDKVYYANGKVAWEGKKGSICYDENGKQLGYADAIYIPLGSDSWLYISSNKAARYELVVAMGPGYYLRVMENLVFLDLYNYVFDIFNEF